MLHWESFFYIMNILAAKTVVNHANFRKRKKRNTTVKASLLEFEYSLMVNHKTCPEVLCKDLFDQSNVINCDIKHILTMKIPNPII